MNTPKNPTGSAPKNPTGPAPKNPTGSAPKNPTTTPVTVLGAGPMGQALAGAFLAAGHPTTVWNRTPAKARPLVEKGATLAATPAEAVAAGELVLICVLNYDAVRAVLEPAAASLAGRTLINVTADAPARAREMADWAARHDVAYLDGAIMTPTTTIGTPDAVYLYSGPRPVYEAHRATLEALAGTATHLGEDPGRAAAYDVALLDFFWTSLSGYAHALALAGSEQIEARDLAPFAHGIVAILPWMIDDFAERLDKGDYTQPFSAVSSAASAMGHIAHTAQAAGLDTGVLRAAQALADGAVAAGHGDKDLAYLATAQRRAGGDAG
ncbi:NAD(P)-binding domain-containing protein [Streptomyces sp. NBC_01795]|uniref:NAD(P)-dependent oxidoreductase n=1 Tax=unclassified Streptomyces TaxID=2593676 RepID=UPI002DDA2743|nr:MULTISPECIES: NAD(P)-binding domain-containing protein [unclassified Streptomyces]WSA95545.1 NAD(P)-binding domain-containing protein [Streptomyces sp. NBC_01795]WSS11833.1 NAD(P)-binding domain-containing protein [Streptomyces sp. NBC_01186]